MHDQNPDLAAEQAAPAAEPAPKATDAPQGAAGVPQSDEQSGAENAGPERGNKEAARYRRQLREAEAERDRLREQLAAHQHSQAERLAAERLQHPGDLWLAGVGVADLLGDDGEVDRSKVVEAMDRVLADRPQLAKPRPDFDAGVRTRQPSPRPSFGQALKDPRSAR